MKSQQSKEESLYDGLKGSPNLGDSFVSGGDWDIDKDYLKHLCTLEEQHLLTGEMRWFPADEFILYEDK
jgi:hypothetical protein